MLFKLIHPLLITSLIFLFVSQISKQKELDSSLQEDDTQETLLSVLTDKECQSYIKTSKAKQASIEQEVDKLSIQLNNLILENTAAERVIKEVPLLQHLTLNVSYLTESGKCLSYFPSQKNEKLETEIEYLLQAFDDEIGERQVQTSADLASGWYPDINSSQ